MTSNSAPKFQLNDELPLVFRRESTMTIEPRSQSQATIEHRSPSQITLWTLPRLEPIPRDQCIIKATVKRIVAHGKSHPVYKKKHFWPQALLKCVLDQRTVERLAEVMCTNGQLQSNQTKDKRDSTEAVMFWAQKFQLNLGMCALLLVLGKFESIKHFIDPEIRFDQLEQIMEDCQFGNNDIVAFNAYYPSFRIPLFTSQRASNICDVIMEKDDIEPWYIETTITQDTSAPQTTTKGGYGEVSKISIYPGQHNFHENERNAVKVSDVENKFALKSLYDNNEDWFQKEVKMLRRFSHENIIVLLAAITRKDSPDKSYYHLLFPWADGNLGTYWKTQWQARKDQSTYLKMSRQIQGIVNAVNFIHNTDSTKLHLDNEPLFGRHGDLKYDNVLWFKQDGEDVLVLSDLGLTAVHRETSRSDVPVAGLPVTRTYRAPECDMAGPNGKVSRSFDIWTLGCLFLDFVIWSLDGWNGVERFKNERMSPYIGGASTQIYFDIKATGQDSKGNFRIKNQIYKIFVYLHNHPNCTQYLHDVLELIQKRMLIVESDAPLIKRIRASDLLRNMESLRNKCENKEYCLGKFPKKIILQEPLPVTASLSSPALYLMNFAAGDAYKQDIYRGESRSVNPLRSNQGQGM